MKDVFSLSPKLSVRFQQIGPDATAMVCDDFYADPVSVREFALSMKFEKSGDLYPGSHATLAPAYTGVSGLLGKLLSLVNTYYLNRMVVLKNGKKVDEFGSVRSDFSVIETPPNELLEAQKQPHKDPVPVFGIIYLNEEPKGGTNFFEFDEAGPKGPQDGYIRGSRGKWRQVGHLEAKFNRLVVYPGFIWHSGDIDSEQMHDGLQLYDKRLTQRLMYR